ncbi:MAG: hypothetical protein V4719_13805 [Planctomycetota bacterium]
MAGWFSRVVQGDAPAEAEPVEFTLTCRCGSVVTGVRSQRMHVAVCPECRYQLCVLPASHYPRPKIRTPKKKPPQPVEPKVSRDVVEDELQTPLPSSRRSSRPAVGTKKPASKKSTVADSKRSERAVRHAPVAPPRSPMVTPLRLIAVGMIAVVSLAGWWVAHRRAVAQAVVTFAEASKAGRTALTGSDFDGAYHQLQRAVTALNLLQREDREARQIRQLAREATAAHGLAMGSLFDLIVETRSARKLSPTNWAQAIKQSYQGKWFLLETNGLQFTSGDPPQWRFTLPLIPGTEPLQMSGDLSNWGRLFGSKPPAHVILAGQFEDIRPLGTEPGQGVEIILRKDSLCLWTSTDLYTALGGTMDEGSQATLTAQARLLELTE